MQSKILFLATCFFLHTAHSSTAQDTWPISTPKAEGMSYDSLNAFDKDISTGKYGLVDAMLITRNGKMVYQKIWRNNYDSAYGKQASEKSALNPLDPGGPYNYYNSWWHPWYKKGNLHSLQSVTKTITSVIIGVAITRNEFPQLTTPVLSFFDTTQIKNIDARKRKLTIRHLLTMTDGIEWNESRLGYNDPNNDCGIMEASFDWVSYVINKPMVEEPGHVFNYNSGASELLSYIFRKATGKDIEEYGVMHLFAPLGIRDYFWKRIPTGLCDTEGGLYLSAADLAKIFYLFFKNGNWNGQQLVSVDWVKASVTPSIEVGRGIKYGYKWWLHEYDNGKQIWAGSGFGGQIPIVIPDLGIVAVFNAWNIVPGKPSLRQNEIVKRIINAIMDKK